MEWLEERWFSAATKERHAATWKYGYTFLLQNFKYFYINFTKNVV